MLASAHPFANIDTAEPFALDLYGRPQRRYGLMYADPNWRFENYSELGEDRNANRYYDCAPVERIMALPFGDIADENCAFCIWVTDPTLPDAFRLIEHLSKPENGGFSYVTVLFTWVKLRKRFTGGRIIDHLRDVFMGCGYYSRKNPEMVLMLSKGSPRRSDRNVRQLVFAPLREHSEKPDEVRDRLVRLFPDGRRIELYARHRRPGWDAWGDEVGKLDIGRTKKREIILPPPAPLPILDAIDRLAA